MSGTNSKEFYVKGSKARKGELQSPFKIDVPDIRQGLTGCTLVALCLTFIQYFPHYSPILAFGMVSYIMTHCVLEACDLLLDFIERYNKDAALSLRRDFTLWIFKQC